LQKKGMINLESTIPRSRSSRSSYNRKKKMSVGTQNRITNIIRQLLLCIAIFVVIFTIKNVDSSITNYLSVQTANVLKTDSNIDYIVSSAKQVFASLNITNDKLKAVFGSHTPDSSPTTIDNSTVPDDMKDKVYDWTLLKDRGFVNPIEGVITSTFGSRINPISKENEFHEGIDISPIGSDDIKSVLDGVVFEAGTNASLGNYVKINHDDIKTMYAHASTVLVKQGQQVKKGEVIAKAGNTGYSAGKHLHFELWKGDLMVNPQGLLNLKVQAEEQK